MFKSKFGIILIIVGLLTISPLAIAQEDTLNGGFEEGVIDLGFDLEVYEKGHNFSLRVDTEPFGIPIFAKVDPDVQTNSIVLDSVTLGAKVPEPFGWEDFYAFGSIPLKFYEEIDQQGETYTATRLAPFKLGAGFKKFFWQNYKIRIEGLVKDPLGDTRQFIARATLQYTF